MALGSWITNQNATAVQYVHYAPYGELIANQRATSYDERFKFTGKERDAESGYNYHGARFLWGDAGFWLSVDPLVDKYIHQSPYLYCNGNPIMLVDLDGRDTLYFNSVGDYTYRTQADGNYVGILQNDDGTIRTFWFQDKQDADRFMTEDEYYDYMSRFGQLKENRLSGVDVVSLESVYRATRPSIGDRLKGRWLAALVGTANKSMDYIHKCSCKNLPIICAIQMFFVPLHSIIKNRENV